jgi:hypothetical protein
MSGSVSTSRRRIPTGLALILMTSTLVLGVSIEHSNTCNTTMDNPCERTGTCSIQGADWFQTVTVDRSDIFDTQGWPGVCDMVHVALVQGNCEPPGGQTSVTAYLTTTSFAEIPSIEGPLACAGKASTTAGAVPDGGNVPGVPLTMSRGTGASVILTWGASCLSTDSDYALYEGMLGSFASHIAVTCSTAGATTWALNPAVGGRYYLAVPTSGVSEGSHGRTSNGAERLPGPTTCLPPDFGGCQ